MRMNGGKSTDRLDALRSRRYRDDGIMFRGCASVCACVRACVRCCAGEGSF